MNADIPDQSPQDPPTPQADTQPTDADPPSDHANPEPAAAAQESETPEPETPENMPTLAQLDDVATELDEVETVLAHLDTKPEELDALVAAAKADGTIDTRPALTVYEKARDNADG